MDTEQLLRRTLDPVMVERGFAAAQGHVDAEGGELIWCGAFDDLAARWPHLPQVDDGHQSLGTGCCVDLVVDVGADGVLDEVSFEAHSLVETLADSGRPELAARTPSFRGVPVAEVAEALRDTVIAMLPV